MDMRPCLSGQHPIGEFFPVLAAPLQTSALLMNLRETVDHGPSLGPWTPVGHTEEAPDSGFGLAKSQLLQSSVSLSSLFVTLIFKLKK